MVLPINLHQRFDRQDPVHPRLEALPAARARLAREALLASLVGVHPFQVPGTVRRRRQLEAERTACERLGQAFAQGTRDVGRIDEEPNLGVRERRPRIEVSSTPRRTGACHPHRAEPRPRRVPPARMDRPFATTREESEYNKQRLASWSAREIRCRVGQDLASQANVSQRVAASKARPRSHSSTWPRSSASTSRQQPGTAVANFFRSRPSSLRNFASRRPMPRSSWRTRCLDG